MPLEDLERYLHARPFAPFRLKLTTGETYEVSHPELVMVGKRSAIIGISHDPTPRYDRYVTVDLLHVTRIEPLDAQPAAGDGAQQ